MDIVVEPQWQPKPSIDDNAPVIVSVLAFRLEQAIEELQKLARKANRYGNEQTTFVVSDRYQKKTLYKDWDGEHRSKMVSYHDIVLYGVSVRVGDYELLARLEHTEAGNILKSVPGHDGQIDERFRHCEPNCEHCKHKRNRKDTFVVRHKMTGIQQQVGRMCLKDHLGIDPSRAIAKFGFLVEASEMASANSDLACLFAQDLEYVLTVAATSIRTDGWVSGAMSVRTEGRVASTKERIAAIWSRSTDKATQQQARRLREAAIEQDVQLAKETIAWLRSGTLGNSDYEHNLVVAGASDIIHNPQILGLLISAVPAFLRAKERQVKKAAELANRRESKHIGEIGQRLKGLRVKLTFTRGLGDNGFGGYTALRKFVTEDGNFLAWITSSNDEDLVPDRWLTIDATVKKHSEYNQIKETTVSRVKIINAE